MEHFSQLLILLLVGHALADYPLQGDFLARGKNQNNPIAGIPWWQCLTAHSVIHAGFVTLITNSLTLGAVEFLLHWMIDYLKSDNQLTFNEDQFLHVGCKVLWAALAVGGI